MLRREQLEAAEAAVRQESSPAQEKTTLSCPPGILTPPASNRKSIELLPN